jgi:RNA polymerase sigma factor (sigma-70 family)
MDFEDMEQQAFMGLMESVTKYDSSKGVKFLSFATVYIRKSIFKYYDSSGQRLRIPAYMRKRIKEYASEKEKMRENSAGSDEIIQERLGWSDKAFQGTIWAIQKIEMMYLDSYVNENDNQSATLLDMIASGEDTSEKAIKGTYDIELHEILQSAMRCLTETERQAIEYKHYQGMNDVQISKILNCTHQNVSLLRKSAYKKIRTGKFGNELLTFLPVRSIRNGGRRIQEDFNDLSQQERNLLI